VPAVNLILTLGKEGVTAPGLNYGLDRVLHGEQYTELKRPLPSHATLTHRARVKDIFDKGKLALVVTEIVSYDESGSELLRNELTTAVRGGGGWGGDRGPSAEVNVPPSRPPDKIVEERIPENQALLYRLSGDWNPLHADPSFAKSFGFDRPILHGLCSFGYAGRHIVEAFAQGGNPDYFKSIKVRFAKAVLPGETLVTEMWRESDQRIVFQCKVKERNEVVISNAAVEFFAAIPKKEPKPAAAKPEGKATPSLVSADIFHAIGAFVERTPEIAEKAKTTFLLKLSQPDSVWTLDLKGSSPSVKAGPGAAPQCTLELSDSDFVAMATGKADAMTLFSTGKLKISGDVMASQKLGFLKKLPPELVQAESAKRASGAATPVVTDTPPTASELFLAIRDHIEHHPELASQIGFVYQFKLKDPDALWLVDLKSGKGGVTEGGGTADCTLEIASDDFLAMTAGKADPMKLFTTGKLKVAGNIMASQKLEFLSKIDPAQAMAVIGKARAAGGAKAATGPVTSAPPRTAQAVAIFAALGKRLGEKPELAKELGVAVTFQVAEPDGVWTVAQGKVIEGASKDAVTTLRLTDTDLASICKGQTTVRNLFQRGRLRVDGEVGVAHRLGLLKGLA
jgi:3-hydroxyacyl-CoA dehydrogenase/3a,7a,12a-trihydroxy-5b-cholest-24-enoyl-CoA hydratase